jgi:hypothetical protein
LFGRRAETWQPKGCVKSLLTFPTAHPSSRAGVASRASDDASRDLCSLGARDPPRAKIPRHGSAAARPHRLGMTR